MKIFLLILSGLLFSACSSDSPPDAKDAIAGDKAQILEVLKIADTKGTVGEAFIEAAKDSSLAAKMRAALDMTGEAKSPTGSSTRSASGAPKDALDKTSDALDKANEKLEKTEKVVDKTGKVIDKAAEIKKKTGDIFK